MIFKEEWEANDNRWVVCDFCDGPLNLKCSTLVLISDKMCVPDWELLPDLEVKNIETHLEKIIC